MPCSYPLLFACSCPEEVGPKRARAPGAALRSPGSSKLWKQEVGARTGRELLGSFSRAGEMPPIPGPLGGGGDSCIQLRLWKGHGGESSHCVPPESGGRELLSHAPPPQISGIPGLGGGAGTGCLPCLGVLRESGGGGSVDAQAGGYESLSNQKAILRPFPARTSIEVPRRTVRRLSQDAAFVLPAASVHSTGTGRKKK